jgi:hypothetical protein
VTETFVIRIVLGALLLATAVLGGCAGLSTTPYNARQACEAVGGLYGGDGGQCAVGNM